MLKISYEQAVQEVGDLISWLTPLIGQAPKLQGGSPNEGVKRAIHEILKDEVSKSRGEFISRVLRLPDVQRNCLSEYVQQAPPYERTGLRLDITVRNVSSTSCRVVRAVRQIPRRDIGNGEVSDAWTTHPTYVNIAPGEELTLPPDMAVHALWKYGRYGKPVYQWDVIGSERASLPLIEVAYRAEFLEIDEELGRDLVPVTIDSRKWQEEKIRKTMAAVKGKSASEKKRIIAQLPNHWELPTEARA
ncbi:MAG: hypothetical protein ACYTBJ_01145 [Planctomycetota bacterium]|jgi:hypothetical protein